MNIIERLRSTRADMLGTDDEEHYRDTHEAADEIERLQAQVKSQGDWIRTANRVMSKQKKELDKT